MKQTPDIPRAGDLFSTQHTIAAGLFSRNPLTWEVLDCIRSFIEQLGPMLDPAQFEHRGNHIYIARSASVAPTAFIGDHTIIDEHAEIRHCAYIRGSAIIGKHAVVGNSCELKNCILFDDVQVPHFNYVGDSILGWKAHIGAGAVTSNVKSDKTPVSVRCGGSLIATGRKKLGAMLGDHAEIGCNSVLCPGTIVGMNTTIYPLSRPRGVIPADSIYKSADNIVHKI